MASIVKFPVGSAARRSTAGQSGSTEGRGDRSADILLFTGVFYQRMEEPAEGAAAGSRRGVRKREEAFSG